MGKHWTMITVGYARIPQETLYQLKINVDMVTQGETSDGSLQEEGLSRKNRSSATMDEILEEVHRLLQRFPDAKVTMIQEPTLPLRHSKPMKGFELDQQMVDLLRTNPEKAKEMFQPILRTVSIRPPRIALQPEKEKDDGNEPAE